MDNIFLIARVLLGFVRLSNDALITFARNVVVMMTGNAHFTSPFPLLADITTAVDNLATLVMEALTGDRLKISARRDARVVLVGLMKQLAAYVQAHCQNNVTILLSSGFLAARRSGPSVMPAIPANPRLTPGPLSGSFYFRYGKVRNADNYSVLLAEAVDGPYTDRGVFSKTRAEITGVTPGKVYFAKVRANGAKGSSDWTEPASKMAM